MALPPLHAQFLDSVLQALAPVFKDYSGNIRTEDMVALMRKATIRYFSLGKDSKWCPKCKDVLERDKFGIDRSRSDGMTSWCRECRSQS